MKRVLVTGANGFVGSHVVELLLNAGCEVIVFLSPLSTPSRLKDIVGRVVLLRGDLHNPQTIADDLMRLRPETCIHLAWYAEPGQYLSSPQNVRCLTGSLALLEILIACGCRHMVATGTCAEYDTNVGYLQEDSPTNPATLYAATKLAFSLTAKQRCDLAGMTFSWARLFYLYGPRENPRRVVPSLIKALLSSQPFAASTGEQMRDYLHVRDVAAALCLISLKKIGGIINVCSEEPVSLKRLLQTTAEFMERPDLIHFGALPTREWEPSSIYGNSSTLRNLGWSPQYTLVDGLRATIEWWRNQTKTM